MNFLVSIHTPGRGSLALGQVVAINQEAAQNQVADLFVEAGMQRDRIAKVSSGKTELNIKGSTIFIVPLLEFNLAKVKAIAALM